MSQDMCHCSRCEQWLPRDSFGVDSQRRDGRKAWCRQCRRDTRIQHYIENRTAILARGAAYERRERERVNERKRVWREKNRDRVRAICRRWAGRHPGKVLIKNARRRGAIILEHIDPAVVLRQFDHRCGICNELLGDKVDFDHIVPLSRGGQHVASNVQPAHPRCNKQKLTKTPPDTLRSNDAEQYRV